MSRRWRRSRVPLVTPVEKYLAVAPIQSTAAGFTPRDVFITQGADIFKSLGEVSSRCLRRPGASSRTTAALTFDHVGTFGNKMIVTCENGPVCCRLTGLELLTHIAIVNVGSRRTLKDQL